MANMELQKSIKNYQDKTRDKTAQFEAEQQAKVDTDCIIRITHIILSFRTQPRST